MAGAVPGRVWPQDIRVWAPPHLRGLLGPGERKSLQPTAARLELVGHDQLQHSVASTDWNDGAVWAVLAHEADLLVGGRCRPCRWQR